MWDSTKNKKLQKLIGNDGITGEIYEDPKHIEIQIIGDHRGKAVIYQKIVLYKTTPKK